MAMTGVVKDELSRVTVVKPCCRKAEVSAMLRFAGGLHLAAGHIVIEAELDTGAAARRLRAGIGEVYGHTSELLVLADVALADGTPRHDPLLLAGAYAEIFGEGSDADGDDRRS